MNSTWVTCWPYFQIPIIVEGLLERLGYSERRKLVKTLFDHDPEGLKEMSTSSFSSFEKVNELGEGEFGRRCRPQLDSGGEQWFKSSEEEEDAFYWRSNLDKMYSIINPESAELIELDDPYGHAHSGKGLKVIKDGYHWSLLKRGFCKTLLFFHRTRCIWAYLFGCIEKCF